MKKSHILIRAFVIVLTAILLTAVLVACNDQNKNCKVTVVGMYNGYELYSTKISYKPSQAKVFEPLEIVGYEFDCFEGAPDLEAVDLTSDLNKNKIKVLYKPKFLNVPVVWINTFGKKQIVSKEDYVSCDVSILNTDGEFELNNVSAGVRGRGNTTWAYDKKPYRIKFDKKQEIFGWKKNKSWVLLALYQDFSDIKDYAAFNLASTFENSAFVPHAKHVELYLNGQYQGLYLLTDQVQENSGRTDVESDFLETDVEIPFLVEWDEYAPLEGDEGEDWFRIYNGDSGVTSYYNVKYPDKEQRFNKAQFDYVKNYIAKVNALCHDAEVSKDEFEEYVDLDAFIDYYLLQEIMGQVEINYKSIYMSKKTDGKLIMGPVWDFDHSAGGPMYLPQISPSGGLCSKYNWFYFMLKVDWFKQACLKRLEDMSDALYGAIDDLAAYKEHIADAAHRNATLWDFDKFDAIPSFDEYYDTVLNFLRTRIELLPSFINNAA